MKIRRYMGSNTQEALQKVKMDLGNDAVILNTRKMRKKGIFHLFSKPLVEVLAAVDEDNSQYKDRSVIKPEKYISANTNKAVEVPKPGIKMLELENKVSNMETMLQKIYNQIQHPLNFDAAQSDENKNGVSGILQTFYSNLMKNDVDKEIAKNLVDSVAEKMSQNPGTEDAASLAYKTISELLGKPETIKLRTDGRATLILFVGPTGVGKTTTLAKLAANFALSEKKKVAFITTDTYRIAAVDQLRTYADILGIPVSVVYTPGDLKDAIDSYDDRDLILIDTAGRSMRNKAQFEELKAFANAFKADETYLLLSVATSMRNCREVIENYSFLEDYKIIFTKQDEASIGGMMLNARYLSKRPLSYITTGQSVPDDIEIANVDRITKNLLGSST